MSDSTEATIAKAIEIRCLDQIEASLRRTKEKDAVNLTITLVDDELRTILIQLEALGLIESTRRKYQGGKMEANTLWSDSARRYFCHQEVAC
jgi:hypothetical protein